MPALLRRLGDRFHLVFIIATVRSGFSRTDIGRRLQPDFLALFRNMFPGHPEYLQHFDYVGFHRYSLTFCTMRRQPLFVTQPVVDLVLEQFLRSAEEERFALIAYCFMPDHVHPLVGVTCETSDGKRFISRAKQHQASTLNSDINSACGSDIRSNGCCETMRRH